MFIINSIVGEGDVGPRVQAEHERRRGRGRGVAVRLRFFFYYGRGGVAGVVARGRHSFLRAFAVFVFVLASQVGQ